MQQTSFYVAELDCASEVSTLRRALGELPGIEALEFDVVQSLMTVRFDSNEMSATAIIERVRSLGMHATVRDNADGEAPREDESQRHRYLWTTACGILLLVGFVCHAQLSGNWLHAIGVESTDSSSVQQDMFPPIVKCIYLAAILVGLWQVAPKAWFALRRRNADMNVLMCIAVTGAMIIGQWLEAATVTFLFSLATLLEHWSMGRARRAIRQLLDLAPRTARVLDPITGQETETDINDVLVGSIITVRPGERIALDGAVSNGVSSVDQSPITGESLPVQKQTGDTVYAGSVNGASALRVTTSRPACDTAMARIVHLVRDAQSGRAGSERWVERFARYYTPAMVMMALLIALAPPLLWSADWTASIYNGLVILVIACPCALVISTPVTIVAALAAAARRGVLIKGGRHLEAAAGIRAVALDKTGTVTRGCLEVQSVLPLNGHDEAELVARAASLESQSTHPIAAAILRFAESKNIQCTTATDHRLLAGSGAAATIAGREFWIGNKRLMEDRVDGGHDVRQQVDQLGTTGQSVVVVGSDRHVCGIIGVADQVREESKLVVDQLAALGIEEVVMLTGDNRTAAHGIANIAGIETVHAELLPEDKWRAIEKLRDRYGSVAMIGDGVNDAPAMAAATLGIAMAAIGSDAAIESADVALMSDDLTKVPWLISHARRTLRVVRQNIGFALLTKLLFVGLTVAGIASLWLAIAADMGASLLVIFNGLRMSLRGTR